jgi:hypothetical protein
MLKDNTHFQYFAIFDIEYANKSLTLILAQFFV